ncbi:MAG: aldo/keto reductase [Candidatus Izemoplasmatales bacterium]|nr:aldo/keto reductase [Candidatus Izemoplasmatales bacterium]
MDVQKAYVLSNDITIPSVGFGTWQIPDGKTAYDATLMAFKHGYRHIDTAAAYGNEPSVGRAIRDAKIPRSEIFVTSKLHAQKKGYQITLDEFQETLDRLGTDYLDLYLIHAPKPWGESGDGSEYHARNIESWKAMIELYHQGKIRAIGVSNFLPMHLDPLIEATSFIPHVNQIYLCPGAPQNDSVAYARAHNILIEAYSPFATGRLFQVELIHELARRIHRSPAQIAMRWSLQKGHLPLPKSVNELRIKENIDVFDFELSESDMAILDILDVPPKVRNA